MRSYVLVLFVILIVIAGAAWWFMSHSLPSIVPVKSSAPTTQQKVATEMRVTPRAQMSVADAAKVKESELAPQVEQVLTKEVQLLQTLSNDASVLAQTRAANETDKKLSADEITHLDDEWIATKNVTPTVQKFIDNPGAKALLVFQKEHPEFKEVFVADGYGLNAAETDKTSDFYQADEWWWVNSMNNGAGRTLHGKIEFDQSSQAEAISIYVPVLDGTTAIGVIKGVIDLSAIGAVL